MTPDPHLLFEGIDKEFYEIEQTVKPAVNFDVSKYIRTKIFERSLYISVFM